MGYLSPTHLLLLGILLVVVFIIWGPGKLPDVGAGLGRAIREFRKASSETREEFSRAAHPEQHHGDAGAAQPHTVADPAATREPTAPEAAAVPASGAPAEPAPSGGGTVLGPPPDSAR